VSSPQGANVVVSAVVAVVVLSGSVLVTVSGEVVVTVSGEVVVTVTVVSGLVVDVAASVNNSSPTIDIVTSSADNKRLMTKLTRHKSRHFGVALSANLLAST